MSETNKQSNNETVSDKDKLELYRLLGEGYKAMRDGRESSLEEVISRLQTRRKERA